ncbi:hypothetical protein Nepgr_032250 [Nepenthes gracilis]|uniref:Uncharacterized protein n=1 Tax=Nepenthes gracilis TaxID=150966 RepID=A0AAD3TKG9_NEPGR|nr:hypothetical protein Nepgr_032250 [Nepenthes gracilis]
MGKELQQQFYQPHSTPRRSFARISARANSQGEATALASMSWRIITTNTQQPSLGCFSHSAMCLQGAFREAASHADLKLRETGWDLATPAIDLVDVDVQPSSRLVLDGLFLYLVSGCCALAWAYERRAGLAEDGFSGCILD